MTTLFSKTRTHFSQYFEATSQSLFFRNSYFGFLMLALLAFFSTETMLCGLSASLIGYIHSTRVSTPKILKQTGLLTINGLFFGIAFASYFRFTPQFYFCLLIGSLLLPIFTKACFEVLQHWKLSPLIGPYILTVWLFFLGARGLALEPVTRSWSNLPSLSNLMGVQAPVEIQLLESVFFSLGEIFFVRDSLFGISLLLLVSLFSARRGFYFLLGTALSTVIHFAISEGSFSWNFGFFSCSAGLVSLGLAAMLEKYSWHTVVFYSVVSLFLTMALAQLLNHFNLPILSLPFVLTFTLAELSRSPRLNVQWAPTQVAVK